MRLFIESDDPKNQPDQTNDDTDPRVDADDNTDDDDDHADYRKNET